MEKRTTEELLQKIQNLESKIKSLENELSNCNQKLNQKDSEIKSLRLDNEEYKATIEELTNALNYKNEEELDLEEIARAVEHFTFYDHTNRTASQVIRDLRK